MIKVSQAIVKCLEAEGIKDIFGYPGAAICPFYDALSNSNIRHILVRHEQHAAHAASGYARASSKPAVCVATSGPGALNLITGIATAYMDSIPMVVITGQVSTELLGRDVFQEADITGAVEPFVKHSYLVKNPHDIPMIFKQAFHLAKTGRPGPVLIDIPVDIQNMKIEFSYPKNVNMRGYKPTIKGHSGQIKRVVTAIKNAKKPIICAGGGVFNANARDSLLAFSNKCDIPIVSTMMGIGCVPSADSNYFGMIGMHGKKIANTALSEADLIILIGARVGDRAIVSPSIFQHKAKIIHIDIDSAEIGKNIEVSIPVVGDANEILNQILDEVSTLEHAEWKQHLLEQKANFEKKLVEIEGFVNPKIFLKKLSEKTPQHTIVVADVGQNQIWTANNFEIKKGRFLTTGGMGTMGYSVGAAMGAKTAKPELEVIAVCGDGSFQMQFMELATICQHNIPIKIVLFKNNRLGMVRELQKNLYANNLNAVFLDKSPDFITLAKAYGIEAMSIDSINQTEDAIEKLLNATKPFILQVNVSPDESTL